MSDSCTGCAVRPPDNKPLVEKCVSVDKFVSGSCDCTSAMKKMSHVVVNVCNGEDTFQ